MEKKLLKLLMKRIKYDESKQEDKTIREVIALVLHLSIFAFFCVYYYLNAAPGISIDMAIKLFGVVYFALWTVVYMVVWVSEKVFWIIFEIVLSLNKIISIKAVDKYIKKYEHTYDLDFTNVDNIHPNNFDNKTLNNLEKTTKNINFTGIY